MRTNLDEMASNVSDGVVKLTGKDVSGRTFMHTVAGSIITIMLQLQRWLECRGIKISGTKSLFMIISHNCQSCMCHQ